MENRQNLVDSPRLIIFLGSIMAVVPFAVDAYLPALSLIADHYGVGLVEVNLTVSTYLIGHALGTFVGGALSDQLGRKPLGSFGLLLFSASTLLIALAETIFQVQMYRIFQAIGGGFAAVVCMAQVRDFYPKDEIPQRMASVMMVMLVAPMIAPMLGFFLLGFGWRTIFVVLTIYSLSLLCVFLLRIPESVHHLPARFEVRTLFSNYWRVVTHKRSGRYMASRYTLFSSLTSGVFFAYLTNSMAILTQYFSLTQFQFCLVFGFGGFCAMMGTVLSKRLMLSMAPMRIASYGNWIHIALLLVVWILSLTEQLGLSGVLVTLFICVSVAGGIRTTVAGVYMTFFDRLSGAAASLHSTVIFLFGGFIGALAAMLSKGSLMPIFGIMFLTSLAARVVLWNMRLDN
jgi:DHA1 family bicyclomycin/chloramphenicol resistance-like MFS transporter